MLGGRLFQIWGPATANDLSPSAVLVRGTSSIEVSADLVPGRRMPAWRQYLVRYPAHVQWGTYGSVLRVCRQLMGHKDSAELTVKLPVYQLSLNEHLDQWWESVPLRKYQGEYHWPYGATCIHIQMWIGLFSPSKWLPRSWSKLHVAFRKNYWSTCSAIVVWRFWVLYLNKPRET